MCRYISIFNHNCLAYIKYEGSLIATHTQNTSIHRSRILIEIMTQQRQATLQSITVGFFVVGLTISNVSNTVTQACKLTNYVHRPCTISCRGYQL